LRCLLIGDNRCWWFAQSQLLRLRGWVSSRRGRPCLPRRPNPNKGDEQRFVG